jgi:hypothetical protein
MALSNAEYQARWRAKHPELDKQRKREWIHQARKDGKIPYNEFYAFKKNPKLSQIMAKNVFKSYGNNERCAQLKATGIEPIKWSLLPGSKLGIIHLEQKHSCNELCRFYGHSGTWTDIEPVAYTVRFHKGGDFGTFKHLYWIFKRYLVVERRLDFPEVKPIFKCSKCGFSQTFEHLDDMFTFQHTCPPKIDPLDEVRLYWIVRGVNQSPIVTSLRKLHAWIGSINSSSGYGFCIGASSDESKGKKGE